jgi:hypothetical protein
MVLGFQVVAFNRIHFKRRMRIISNNSSSKPNEDIDPKFPIPNSVRLESVYFTLQKKKKLAAKHDESVGGANLSI